MESLCNYSSDDENDSNKNDGSKESVGDDDVNYDNVAMDLSEDNLSKEKDDLSGSSRSQSRSPSRTTQEKRSRSRSAEATSQKNYKKDEKRKSSRRDRDRDRERERRRSRSRSPHRSRRRSRSPRHSYHHRSRSPRRDSRSRRERSPKSRSPERRAEKFDSKKPNKLSLLKKFGIELKVPETETKSPGLPNFINPLQMNPTRYSEQIAKRKLLWSNTKSKEGESEPSNSKSSIWQGATFSQDQDGKLTAKFHRLMGIKQGQTGEAGTSAPDPKSKDLIKKQEELFSSMELQYEVARAATHTQRGVGLGFGGTHHFPR